MVSYKFYLFSAVAWGGAGGARAPPKLVNSKLKYSIQKKRSNNFVLCPPNIFNPATALLFANAPS